MNLKKALSISVLLFGQNIGNTAICPVGVDQTQNQSLSHDNKDSIDINQISMLDNLNETLDNLCIKNTNMETGHLNLIDLCPGINSILQDLGLDSILDKHYLSLGNRLCETDAISTSEKLFFKLFMNLITGDKILDPSFYNNKPNDFPDIEGENWKTLSPDENILLSTILMMKSSHDIYKKNLTSQNKDIPPYSINNYSQKYFAILFDMLHNINQYEFEESISELNNISNALNNIYINSKLNVAQQTQNRINQIISSIISRLVNQTIAADPSVSIRELQEDETNMLYLIFSMQYARLYSLQASDFTTKKVIHDIRKTVILRYLKDEFRNLYSTFFNIIYDMYTKLNLNRKCLDILQDNQNLLSFEHIKILKLASSLWEVYLQHQDDKCLYTTLLLMSRIGSRSLWDINYILHNLRATIKSDSACICI